MNPSRTFIVDFVAGSLVDASTSAEVPGYTGVVDGGERTLCGMEVTAINMETDVGQWSCLMNEEATYFQKGTFQVGKCSILMRYETI